MNSEEVLTARREQAIQKWTDAVFALYPFETTGFIRTQKDRFANPVGYATRKAAVAVFDAISGRDVEMDAVHAALGDLIRIRAVQDYRPDQAICVLILVMPVLRELSPGWTLWFWWRSTCISGIGRGFMPSVWQSSAGETPR